MTTKKKRFDINGGFIFMNSKENRLRYILGLDGLRAVAVLAVIAYHLHIGPASGGFLGVDLFFVISGYLITTILLHKQDLGYQELLPFWMGSDQKASSSCLRDDFFNRQLVCDCGFECTIVHSWRCLIFLFLCQ